ncbi:MAG: thioredoxin domain-containing protein [Nitrospinae bacterium]|nr:thioredoxin domain-containing protein [Nitrospinota bacterium]
MDEHRFTNLLVHEKSPYLLQHAHNPVHWRPWGEEAFKIAREQNKPLLVSIGYATCHWCHVMERESFEDPQLAELLNAGFVCVKVDREERPDVDSIYMQALQSMGQQGGWPLNVFVTPEGLPFHGGTYFPPQPRFHLPSFANVLEFLSGLWKNDPGKVQRQSQAIVAHLKESAVRTETGALDALDFEGEDRAAKLYESHYDTLNHGFRFQPQNKFPPSMGLSLLLRHYRRTGRKPSLDMAVNTLRAMKNGGIYDQIGGGLSRYSTDYRWLVPHFEKMLYDNALFVTALVETCQAGGAPEFADHANDVLAYIDRDMTSPDGAFYSAEDADSEGVEGKFYVWTQEEIEKVLGRQTASVTLDPNGSIRMANEDRRGQSEPGHPAPGRSPASVAGPYYNVTPRGNFERKNILHVTRAPAELAKELGLPEAAVVEELGKARSLLLEERSKRIRPLLDDKILVSWNGLMISAMARAGRVLDDPERIRRAERAADFILTRMRAPDGGLYRRFRQGDARYDGYLFDYTSLAVACLELYEATYKPTYVKLAAELMRLTDEKFASGDGAYHETPADGENLIVRQISGYDGVEPSGNSNAALALLKLAAYLADPAYERKAEKIFLVFHEDLMDYGLNSSFMMQALHLYLGGLKEVAVVGRRDDPSTQAMLRTVRQGFFPNAVFAFAYEDEAETAARDVPLLANRKTVDGKATAYVCRRGACLPPTTSPDELVSLLGYE